jgi:hypothetical protein
VVFLDAIDSLDEQSLDECWSQSTSIMTNPTTNPKTLDMLQDAKFRNLVQNASESTKKYQ